MKKGTSSGQNSRRHPGAKLLEEGPDTLTQAELLAVLISTGTKDRSAEMIADDLIFKFQSFRGMAGQPIDKIMEIKGLKQVKLCRIMAAFEIARRVVDEVLGELGVDEDSE